MEDDMDFGEIIADMEEGLSVGTPYLNLLSNGELSIQAGGISTLDIGDTRTTVPVPEFADLRGEIGYREPITPINWDSEPIVMNASRMSTGVLRSVSDRMADYMQEYLSIRNNEMDMLINYNTVNRNVTYDDIEAVIMFREKLDRIITDHYRERR